MGWFGDPQFFREPPDKFVGGNTAAGWHSELPTLKINHRNSRSLIGSRYYPCPIRFNIILYIYIYINFYICIHTYTHTHIYIYIYIHISLYICIHTHTSLSIYTHTHLSLSLYLHTYITHTHTYMYIYICMYVISYLYTFHYEVSKILGDKSQGSRMGIRFNSRPLTTPHCRPPGFWFLELLFFTL